MSTNYQLSARTAKAGIKNFITVRQSVARSIVLFFLLFFTMTVHYIFKTGPMAVLIKTFSAGKMPWFDVADFGFTLIITMAIITLKKYTRISVIIQSITLFFCTILLMLPFIFNSPQWQMPKLVTFSLIANVLVYIATYGIWMLTVSSAFKRVWLTFAIIGAGAQLGVFVGGLLGNSIIIKNFAELSSTIIGAIYILIFSILAICIRKFSCGGVSTSVLTAKTNNPASGQASAKASWADRPVYIILILMVLLIGAIIGRSVNWFVQNLADYKATIKEASGFLATFYTSNAIFSLLVQLILTPIFLKTFKLKWGLLIQPFLAILLVALFFIKADTTLAVIPLIIYTAVDYTIFSSFKEKLWLYVPLTSKIKDKAVTSLIVPKIAALINAALILFLYPVSLTAVKVLLLGFIIIWIIVIINVSNREQKYEAIKITDLRSSLDEVE